MEHWKICEAPICAGYPTEDLLWYPDEKICGKIPYTKWQKKQRKIQKLFKKGKINPDRYFTVEMLLKMKKVRNPKGKDPNVHV